MGARAGTDAWGNENPLVPARIRTLARPARSLDGTTGHYEVTMYGHDKHMHKFLSLSESRTAQETDTVSSHEQRSCAATTAITCTVGWPTG